MTAAAHGQWTPGGGGPGGGSGQVIAMVDWEARLNIDERLQPLGDDLMGDQIDPHTGALEFLQTDIVLPGDSGLEVALRRQVRQGKPYGTDAVEFGDWEIVAPRLKIVTAALRPWTGARCTSSFGSQFSSIYYAGRNFRRNEYTNGLTLQVGGSSEAVLENPRGAPWPSGASHVTNSYWHFECLGNDRFIGHAPDGTTYRFDHHIVRDAMPLEVTQYGLMPLMRNTHVLAATEVTDRHGNWVRYDYDTAGRLTRIHANDGREILLTYSGASHLVSTASANGRTWTYSYRAGTVPDGAWTWPSHAGAGTVLASATLPDGRAWTFGLDGLQQSTPASRFCLGGGQLSLTHPDGVQGEFDLWLLKHRTAFNVQISQPSQCPEWDLQQPPGSGSYPVIDSVATPVFGVTRKALTAAGSPSAVWTYDYEQDLIAGTSAGDPTNWTRVTGPDGVRTFYHLWNDQPAGGSLVREQRRATAAGPVLEDIESDYLIESSFGDSAAMDTNAPMSTVTRNKRVIAVERTRDGTTYTRESTYITAPAANDYSFGQAVTTRAFSTLPGAGQRLTEIDYLHDRIQWVLGLPTRVTRNGKIFEEAGYDANRMPVWIDHFGVRVETRGYNTNGTLAWVRDGLNRQTSLSNYYRGHPRTITRADGSQIFLQVDADGRITRVTNARGTATDYTYNASGWLTAVNRPSGYDNTTITYSSLGAGVVMTATTGASETRTTHDRFHRPTETRLRALWGGGGSIYTRLAYDALGRAVFESFPSASPNPTAGVDMEYDALGRVVSTAETVTPNAQTLTVYLTGNRVQVTDPAGNITTTHATGYASPNDGEAVRIDHPLGLTTQMTHDVWGNLLTARQYGTHSGISVDETQVWAYDSRLRLCRHATPQSGHTLYAYDAANQMTGVARGAPPGSGCAGLPASQRVSTSYDLLGRVDIVNFPDSSPDIALNYDANGNLTAANRGTTSWAYAYDALDRLTNEVLTVDGRIYAGAMSYTADGRLATRTTPAGRSISFAPNGHGRPTRARIGGTDYASGAVYAPDGQLASVQYGNQTSYTATFDARRQLASQRVAASAGDVQHLAYTRDALGRVSVIDDHALPGEDRSFTYDALGRLTSASGPWGAGTYTYDLLNNIRSKTLGLRSVDMEYNAAGRMSRYRDTGDGGAWRDQAYDARGNTTNDGLHGFVYDLSERPVAISGGASGGFLYDAHGRRVKQTLNGETIYTVYGLDGTLLYRDNASTGETTDYVDMGSHSVGRYDQAGVFTFINTDQLGSATVAMNATGSMLWREHYTPFGEVMANPVANRDEAGFTGHIRDQATGLTYAQARYYNPVTARFLAPDPVGFSEAGWRHLNRYGYAYNDPVNATDPTGEIPVETVWDAANVGMGAASFTGNARSGNWGGAAVDAVGVLVDTAATLIPYVPGGAGAAIKGVRAGAEVVQGARQAGRGPDFISNSDGVTMSASKDMNLVDTQTPTNEGGDWLQIHNTHTDARGGGAPHTHRPGAASTGPNGQTSRPRETGTTTGADMTEADQRLRSGELRIRDDRQDRGGPK